MLVAILKLHSISAGTYTSTTVMISTFCSGSYTKQYAHKLVSAAFRGP